MATPFYTKVETDVRIDERVRPIEENQITGVKVFSTYALMDAQVAPEENVSFKVSNDPDTVLINSPKSNNGYYHWNGTVYVKDAELHNGIIENGNTEAISGDTAHKSFVENNSRGLSLGFVKGLFEDEFLELSSTITRLENAGGDGYVVNASIYTNSYDDTEKINGFKRTVAVTPTAVGTILEFQLLAATLLKLKTKQINVSCTLLFPIDISVNVFLYKRGGTNQNLTTPKSISFYAGIEKTVNLTSFLTDLQKSEMTSLYFYISNTNAALNTLKFYASPVFVTDGENKLTNSNPERIKKYIEDSGIKANEVGDNLRSFYPYVEFFNCVGYKTIIKQNLYYRTFHGFIEELSFSNYAIELTKKFLGYDKSLAVNVTSGTAGARMSWQLPYSKISEDLKIEKKLNVRFQLIFPVNVSVNIGVFAYKDANTGWIDGGQRAKIINAGEIFTIDEVFTLTDDNFVGLQSLVIFIRHESSIGLAAMNGDTFFVSSMNIWSGERKVDLAYIPESSSSDITQIECWGDSITAANLYQPGIASELDLNSSNVSNHGVSSDWTQHIRNRFIDYYTTNPLELQNKFFVIFMGTNNLLNYTGRSAAWTTADSSYVALQPNADFNYDTLWAKSYRDQFLNDIKQILDLIPDNNFLIIPGHCGAKRLKTEDRWNAMDELDTFISRMYPNNSLMIRYVLAQDYNYLNVFVTANFVKPVIGSSVNVSLSDVSWINDSVKNITGKLAIGTKQNYDLYDIVSVTGSVATCTLETSGLNIPSGDTVRFEYNLVSDIGRGAVTMKMQCFSYDDIISFENENWPQSITDSAGIHPTNYYTRLGELIGKKISKILNIK